MLPSKSVRDGRGGQHFASTPVNRADDEGEPVTGDETSGLANVRVVLHEPQDPVNIAATIRAMKNMGCSDLYLVRSVPTTRGGSRGLRTTPRTSSRGSETVTPSTRRSRASFASADLRRGGAPRSATSPRRAPRAPSSCSSPPPARSRSSLVARTRDCRTRSSIARTWW